MVKIVDDKTGQVVRDTNQNYEVQFKGETWRVIDGDTLTKVEDPTNPDWVAETIRVKGTQSPETMHGTYKDGEITGYTLDQVGSQHAKDVLFNVLNRGDFDDISEKKLQSVGKGAGQRYEANLINSATGEDFTSWALTNGLAEPTSWTSEQDKQAYDTGKIIREINGGSKDLLVEALRNGLPVNSNGFKEKALFASELRELTEKQKAKAVADGTLPAWYDPSEWLDGSETQFKGEGWDGSALNPLSTRFVNAWYGAKADLGGAINALGYGVGSEKLKTYGQTVADVNKQKVANAPWTKINTLADIDDYSEDTFDYITNTLSWAGGHAVSSIPYLGAIAGGTLIAGAAAPVIGGTAALAASIIPSSSLAAGGIWNSVDLDKRDAKAAGYTFVMGTAAGTLERLGLAGIVKPSAFLSKVGRDKVINHVARVRGVDHKVATGIVNKNYKKEARNFLTTARNATVSDINSQRQLVGGLTRILAGGGSEAATEAGQEAIQFLTASSINRDPKTATALLEHLKAEAGNSQLWENVLEGVAAGGALGSGFSAIGEARTAGFKASTRAKLARGNTGALSAIPKAFVENASDGTLRDLSIEAEQEYRRNPNKYKGKLAKLTAEGRKNGNYAQWKRGDIGTLEAAGKAFNSLWIEPARKSGIDKYLPKSKALRTYYSTVSGIRGSYAGQNAEQDQQSLVGLMRSIGNLEGIGRRHGFNVNRPKQVAEFGQKLVKYAQLTTPTDPKYIADDAKRAEALNAIGITAKDLPSFKKTAQERANAANFQYEAKLKAIGETNGIGSSKYKEFAKKRSDWWYSHRSLDPVKVRNNKEGFIKWISNIYNKSHGQLTKDEKNMGAAAYAQHIYEQIALENPLSDFSRIGEDATTLVNRGRVLDLSSRDGFEAFAEENFFAGHDRSIHKTATEIAHLKAYGDKGSKLDVLFTKAEEELRLAGVPQQEIDNLLQPLAATTQDVIDASTGNYNVVKNEQIRALMNGALAYTGFISLPFAALASIPETAVGLLKAVSSEQMSKHMDHVMKAWFDSVGKAFKNLPTTVLGSKIYKPRPRVDAQYFELMQRIGVPTDASSITRRVGGAGEGVSPSLRNVMDNFFWFTGLQGLTEIQRSALISTGMDIIRDNTELLMEVVGVDGNIDIKVMNEQQLTALSSLQQMGINVPSIIAMQHKMEQAGANPHSEFDKILKGTKPEDASIPAWQHEVETGLVQYINSHVQDPKAANRPLWTQDPRFKLFSQFNTFLATTTNTIIPSMWNDQVGRSIRAKAPGLSQQAFTVFVLMVALGGASQWLRDLLKYGESTPYLQTNSKLFQRALGASGTLGQFEKLLDVITPLYDTRGQGIVKNVIQTAAGPGGRQTEIIADILTPSDKDTKQEFWADVLKFVPAVNVFPEARRDLATWLSK